MAEKVDLLSKKYVQPVALAFLLTLVVATLLEKFHVRFIPESAVVIAVGAALGFGMQMFRQFPSDILHHVSAPVVNMLLLPVIIFESGWSLRHKDFAAQFVYILLFAVVGTFIAITVVGSLIISTGHLHGISDPRTAFTFASLISATDPVATLATYSSLQVEPLLHIMVFGESTVNDAVAIVVFDILNGEDVYGPPGSDVEVSVANIVYRMAVGICAKLAGSVAIGLILSVIYVALLRAADMRHSTSMEILFIVTSCYFTFATAEQMRMSGIIAVLFAGIFMGIYGKRHLSPHGSELATFFVKELAAWADMSIFLLVGMNVVLVSSASWFFTLWVMLFLLVGRAFAVFPTGIAVNFLKRCFAKGHKQKPLLLSGRHLLMMWHAGLRGGIALVLCLEMGDWVDLRNGPGTKQTLINTTVVVIIVFLLVFGGSTGKSLEVMGIPTGMDVDEGYLYDRTLLNSFHRIFKTLDERILSPVLAPKGDSTAATHPEEAQLDTADAACGSPVLFGPGGAGSLDQRSALADPAAVAATVAQRNRNNGGRYWFSRSSPDLSQNVYSRHLDDGRDDSDTSPSGSDSGGSASSPWRE